MDISIAKILLEEFESIPKSNYQSTYLEICRYPFMRFEEICSRLLAFFMQPQNEHKLGDLFIRSFIQAAGHNEVLNFNFNKISITEEENADGKRIDLVITGSEFIIGIENKISAQLTNPLSIYSQRLKKENKKHTLGVILSLKKFNKKNELQFIKDNGFENITYFKYFSYIKQNIGFYLNTENQKYLTMALDFIKTIENMDSTYFSANEMSRFFFDNQNQLSELIEKYRDFEQKVAAIQTQQIASLEEMIIERTSDKGWWVYENYDLGYKFDGTREGVGIESSFYGSNYNPLGTYRIQINSWKYSDWLEFEKDIIELFPNKKIEKRDNRSFMTIRELDESTPEQIVNALAEVYDKIKVMLDAKKDDNVAFKNL